MRYALVEDTGTMFLLDYGNFILTLAWLNTCQTILKSQIYWGCRPILTKLLRKNFRIFLSLLSKYFDMKMGLIIVFKIHCGQQKIKSPLNVACGFNVTKGSKMSFNFHFRTKIAQRSFVNTPLDLEWIFYSLETTFYI